MSFPDLLGTAIGTSVNVALLAYFSRRLLNIPHFSFTRTVVAGLLGVLGGNTIIRALGTGLKDPASHVGTAIAITGLGAASSVLVAMAILVTWQALIPAGTIPPPATWPARARRRWRRTRRYWRIVRIFTRAGLAPLLRSRDLPLTASLARSLSHALDRCGVVFTKFGQALSTRRDLLPAEFTAELSRLQDTVTPLPWPQVEQVLHEERLLDAFTDIDHEPLAAASIAQVHAATLRTGEQVVLKVRRPGVPEIADRDLDIIARLARRLHGRTAWARSIGLNQLAEGFAAALREELDFRVEAANLEAVGADREVPIAVPRTFADLSGERVLVMERLDGHPISKANLAVLPASARAELARDLFDTMLRQILIDGVFHADPHPGNILLLGDGRLGLIDFGSVGRLDSQLRAALGRLLLALDRGDAVALTDALLEVTARPDELDEHGLERAVGALVGRLRGAGADAAMFAELFRIVARFQLSVPPEFAAVFRALSTLEGGLTLLAPGFDIVAEAERFGAAMRPADPGSLKDAVTSEAMALLPMLRRLPRRLDRIVAATEGGRLSLNIRLLADERDRHLIGTWLQQIVVTVLAATAGIMAVVLLTIRGGPSVAPAVTFYQFLGYCLLVIASLLALRVLAVVFTHRSRE